MKTKYVAAIALSFILLNPLNANAEGKGGLAAVVNGEKITVDEIKSVYNNAPQINGRENWGAFYDKALNVWVSSKLVQQAANKSGVRNTKEFKDQMDALGNDVASKLYLKQELDKRISDNDLKNLYNQYKNNFVTEKEMRARHILVDNEATAKDIIARVKKGEKFNDLAAQYSKEKRVDLGYFTKRMMVPEFGEAAFAMKKGQLSQTPIKSQFGYHIIYVDDVRDSKPLSYKEAEPQLKGVLAQEAARGLMADMNKSAQIEKYSLDGKVIQ
ncbi:MAG: peptidyl-prolyl cis-trans isomerase [Alphaproteobacteria bacterium]|nr:peptidyl-prolyl cis-trans isomerase [Alphaproteobacteria bacterium]